jgi:hypothetical protein
MQVTFDSVLPLDGTPYSLTNTVSCSADVTYLFLSLALFMLRICGTHHIQHAFTANVLAVAADLFDRNTYFHSLVHISEDVEYTSRGGF